MSKSIALPSFKACETKRGSDWSVLVTWPDQREQYLDGFQSVDETTAWIEGKSKAWLEAQQLNASPSAPRRYDHIWSRFEKTSTEPTYASSCASNANMPDVRVVDAIDQLINVLNTHKDSAVKDRKARGEAFKDEQSSE